jgi:DNA ligase 1
MAMLFNCLSCGCRTRHAIRHATWVLWALGLCLTAYVQQAGAEPSQSSQPGKAPAILLANVLSESIDVTRYLVSEKYDGVRAIWDGKGLRFRSGNIVNAPGWFISKLPATPLDGELWLERGQFETLSGIVRKSVPVDAEWRRLKYMIFELPDAAGSFADRALKIQEIVNAANWPQLQAVTQYRVADRKALKRKLDEVVKAGGEGLMLHLAEAPYTTGRSDVLLKLKPLLDTEAVVIAHIAGKGKYTGMMGALVVKTPEGITFKIGTGFRDIDRKNPPPIGSTITYNYRDLTKNGVPRFASFLRIRHDP